MPVFLRNGFIKHCSSDMDFEGLLATLPPAEFAFAYGSGVFEQKGYEHQKDPPMIDLVVAVADPVAWHEENLRRNRDHYTFLGSFGGAAIARMQEDFGAGLYYNTLVSCLAVSRKRVAAAALACRLSPV